MLIKTFGCAIFRRQIFVLSFLLALVPAFSQNSDTASTTVSSSTLMLAYNSSMIYPGLRLGIGIPISTKQVMRYNKSGDKKDYYKDRFITANLGWYHQTGFHDNLYLTAGWTMRKTKSNGFFTDFSPEMGLSRTFLGGTTYKVDNNGNVSIKKNYGYYYALLSIGGGIGYDFDQTRHLPLLVFSKLNLLMMFPYNSTIYARTAIEFGVAFKPTHFLRIKVKSKNISK